MEGRDEIGVGCYPVDDRADCQADDQEEDRVLKLPLGTLRRRVHLFWRCGSGLRPAEDDNPIHLIHKHL